MMAMIRIALGLLLVAPVCESQTVYYPLGVGNMWVVEATPDIIFRDTFFVSRDTVMPNGELYAVVQEYAAPRYLRQEDNIVYQYYPYPGSEYPIYDFSLPPYSQVSRIPYYYDSVFIDTMRVWFGTQEDDTVFGLDVTGWQYAFDPSPLAMDEEYAHVVVDSLGVIRWDFSYYSLNLVGARIDGRSYGVLTDIPYTPDRPLPLRSRAMSYPDPFNTTTTLSFNLDRPASTTIRIYNILGETVLDESLGELIPGPHDHVIRAAGLPSGVYYYRVEAGMEMMVGRMLLIR